MIEYIRVHCPRCGKYIDAKVIVKSVSIDGKYVRVDWWSSAIDHKCPEVPK